MGHGAHGWSASSQSGKSSIIEALESRQFLSAVPITGEAPTEKVTAVVPRMIMAGKTGSMTLTVHNPNTVAETDAVSLTVLPSLDRSTAASSEPLATISTTINLRARGNAIVRLPLSIPADSSGGQFYALVTGTIGDNSFTVSTATKFTLIGPVLTPSLIGNYSGLIEGETHSGTFGGGNHISELSFLLRPSSQTLTSLTGLVAVGEQQTQGTLAGSEFSNGKVNYTFASADINFTMVGRLVAGGKFIEGTLSGTFTDNLFASINGAFKLTLKPS